MADKKSEKKSKKLTKYERARMLGSRALQISMGAPFLVKLTKKQLQGLNYDPLAIAKLEFEKSKVPLDVHRPLPVSAREQ